MDTPSKSSARSTSSRDVLGDSPDDRDIFIPYWTYKKLYPDGERSFHQRPGYRGQMDEAQDEIRGLLRRRRHVKPSDPDNFGISTAESLITEFRQIIGTVGLVMVVISSIGLLVGGIGVMDIMLVSVTERTREIGVRKAVGARRRDIAWQFLLEAIALTGSGGLIGIARGLAAELPDPNAGAQPAFHRSALVRGGGLRRFHERRPVLRTLARPEGGAARPHHRLAL